MLKIPKSVSFQDAALTEPAAVVYHAVKKSGLLSSKKSKKILIIGSGFLFCELEIIKIKKPKNIINIIDRNNFKLKKAKKYSDITYNLKIKKDWSDFIEEKKSSYGNLS